MARARANWRAHSTIPANYAAAYLLHVHYHVQRASRLAAHGTCSRYDATCACRVNCVGSLIRGDNSEPEAMRREYQRIRNNKLVRNNKFTPPGVLLQSNSISIQLPSITLNLSTEKHFHTMAIVRFMAMECLSCMKSRKRRAGQRQTRSEYETRACQWYHYKFDTHEHASSLFSTSAFAQFDQSISRPVSSPRAKIDRVSRTITIRSRFNETNYPR